MARKRIYDHYTVEYDEVNHLVFNANHIVDKRTLNKFSIEHKN